jgi:MFS family permease
MSAEATVAAKEKKSPLREIVQPFVDLVRAPRALWGINVSYFLEGLCYFGVLNYLAIYFSDYVFKGVEHADEHSHLMVMVLTAGITISMFILGFVPDRWGFRRAMLFALALLVVGRVLIAAAGTVLGLQPNGLWSGLQIITLLGIVVVVIGYGMYQPAAYAGVRRITTAKTSAMAFGMLYAVMNLGIFCVSGAFFLREDEYAGFGIRGMFWVYSALTLVGLIATVLILSRRTAEDAIARARRESEQGPMAEEAKLDSAKVVTTPIVVEESVSIPLHLWLVPVALLVLIYLEAPGHWRYYLGIPVLIAPLVIALLPADWRGPTVRWIAKHPLGNGKFFVFIFALMPVQTLFAYNWLILPQYLTRAFEGGWIGQKFEVASNINPLLIFILVPIITALTQGRKVYNMILLGTLIMAAPAFLLALGPYPWTLFGYLVIMTIGEAMWQPRFLQFAAEIAPEGRTGQYMGVAQLPWFMTKMLVPMLYSGKILERYCPATGPKDTQTMWLIFGCIAVCTPLLLLLAKGWVGKSLKTKAA